MGKAIRYALNQESVPRVFCTDGRLPIDNNPAERILRLIVAVLRQRERRQDGGGASFAVGERPPARLE